MHLNVTQQVQSQAPPEQAPVLALKYRIPGLFVFSNQKQRGGRCWSLVHVAAPSMIPGWLSSGAMGKDATADSHDDLSAKLVQPACASQLEPEV